MPTCMGVRAVCGPYPFGVRCLMLVAGCCLASAVLLLPDAPPKGEVALLLVCGPVPFWAQPQGSLIHYLYGKM